MSRRSSARAMGGGRGSLKRQGKKKESKTGVGASTCTLLCGMCACKIRRGGEEGREFECGPVSGGGGGEFKSVPMRGCGFSVVFGGMQVQ